MITLKEGALAYIVAGTHSGEKASVLEIIPGTVTREKIVKLKAEKKEFETTAKYVFVIGDKKEEIEELK